MEGKSTYKHWEISTKDIASGSNYYATFYTDSWNIDSSSGVWSGSHTTVEAHTGATNPGYHKASFYYGNVGANKTYPDSVKAKFFIKY